MSNLFLLPRYVAFSHGLSLSVHVCGVCCLVHPREANPKGMPCKEAKEFGRSSCRRSIHQNKHPTTQNKIITARWRDREEPAPPPPPLRVEVNPATNRSCQRIPTPSIPHLGGRLATHMLPRSTRLQKTDLRYPPWQILRSNRHQIVALISKAATHYPVPNPR